MSTSPLTGQLTDNGLVPLPRFVRVATSSSLLVGSHSNHATVGTPRGCTIPLSVAVVSATSVAGSVLAAISKRCLAGKGEPANAVSTACTLQ